MKITVFGDSLCDEGVSGHAFKIKVSGGGEKAPVAFVISDTSDGGISITCVSDRIIRITPRCANQVDIHGDEP